MLLIFRQFSQTAQGLLTSGHKYGFAWAQVQSHHCLSDSCFSHSPGGVISLGSVVGAELQNKSTGGPMVGRGNGSCLMSDVGIPGRQVVAPEDIGNTAELSSANPVSPRIFGIAFVSGFWRLLPWRGIGYSFSSWSRHLPTFWRTRRNTHFSPSYLAPQCLHSCHPSWKR